MRALIDRIQAVRFRMRYGVSKALFSSTVEGNTTLLRIMAKLRVTEREAAKFLQLFEKVDLDHSGSIDIEEFFSYFRLDRNGFVERAFNVMDFDKTGSHGGAGAGAMNYTEFFISLYNFCTLTHDTLVRFTFQVVDKDGSGTISKDELFEFLEEISDSRSSAKTHMLTTRVMNILGGNKSGAVTLRDFVRCSRQVTSMLFPAFRLQKKLRSRTMSKAFWNKATRLRLNMDRHGVGDLIKLYKDVLQEINAAEERKRLAEVEAEARERAFQELKENELTDADLLRIEEEVDTFLTDEASARNVGADMITNHHAEGPTNKSEALGTKDKRVQREPRSGDWWDECGKLEELEPPKIADFPRTASRNLPCKPQKLKVDPRTADVLVTLQAKRAKATEIVAKVEDMKRRIDKLRTFVDEVERRKQERQQRRLQLQQEARERMGIQVERPVASRDRAAVVSFAGSDTGTGSEDIFDFGTDSTERKACCCWRYCCCCCCCCFRRCCGAQPKKRTHWTERAHVATGTATAARVHTKDDK